jgi:hypothetical protein
MSLGAKALFARRMAKVEAKEYNILASSNSQHEKGMLDRAFTEEERIVRDEGSALRRGLTILIFRT